MPIRLTLRTKKDVSPFREMLHWLITSIHGGTVVLCSGYIWEPCGANSGCTNYSVLQDGLLSSLISGNPDKVITVAGKFSQTQWRYYYHNFVNALSRHFQTTAFIAPRRNWHAKIAIRLDGKGKPIAALVGSSNLTGPAYGIKRRNWNFEGDVLIWAPRSDLNQTFGRPFENGDLPFGDFHLILNHDKQQPSEEEQLQMLYRDVIESGIEPFA